MAGKTQPDRWEATWLAAGMAVAGAPFLFGRLGSLMQTSFLSVAAFLHSAPVLLVAVGVVLLLAEQGALTSGAAKREKQGARHEL